MSPPPFVPLVLVLVAAVVDRDALASVDGQEAGFVSATPEGAVQD